MIQTKVDSTTIDSIGRRIIKFLGFGKSDVRTATHIAPFGIDSNPLKNMIAIYSPTSNKGESVVIGYINKKQVADIGETRLFSMDQQGNVKAFLWLKNDGTIEIGGNSDNLLGFKKTKEVVEELQNDIKTLKQVFTTWAPVANDGGSALKIASSSWAGTALQKDIDDAKLDKIKTL